MSPGHHCSCQLRCGSLPWTGSCWAVAGPRLCGDSLWHSSWPVVPDSWLWPWSPACTETSGLQYCVSAGPQALPHSHTIFNSQNSLYCPLKKSSLPHINDTSRKKKSYIFKVVKADLPKMFTSAKRKSLQNNELTTSWRHQEKEITK